jgi:hypothetical protein
MTKVPGAGGVERAIRNVKREIKGSLKQIHHHASKLLSRGNYAGAQALVDVARLVGTFELEVETLREKWRSLRGGGTSSGAKVEKTPLWEYYRPILQALVSGDGRASTSELLSRVEPLLAKALKPEDFETMSNGRPRWQVMVRRARRPMRKEGFIEADGGKEWRITSVGRKAASGQSPAK